MVQCMRQITRIEIRCNFLYIMLACKGRFTALKAVLLMTVFSEVLYRLKYRLLRIKDVFG